MVEHPPSTLKVWNINSISSQTMSNIVWFCYIGSSINNKLCNVILASLFFTFFWYPCNFLKHTNIYALFNHTSLHCAMLEWIFLEVFYFYLLFARICDFLKINGIYSRQDHHWAIVGNESFSRDGINKTRSLVPL